MYRVLIDVSNFDWKAKWSTLIYTVKTHAMSNFVNAFRNKLDIIEVLDWAKDSDELTLLLGKNLVD